MRMPDRFNPLIKVLIASSMLSAGCEPLIRSYVDYQVPRDQYTLTSPPPKSTSTATPWYPQTPIESQTPDMTATHLQQHVNEGLTQTPVAQTKEAGIATLASNKELQAIYMKKLPKGIENMVVSIKINYSRCTYTNILAEPLFLEGIGAPSAYLAYFLTSYHCEGGFLNDTVYIKSIRDHRSKSSQTRSGVLLGAIPNNMEGHKQKVVSVIMDARNYKGLSSLHEYKGIENLDLDRLQPYNPSFTDTVAVGFPISLGTIVPVADRGTNLYEIPGSNYLDPGDPLLIAGSITIGNNGASGGPAFCRSGGDKYQNICGLFEQKTLDDPQRTLWYELTDKSIEDIKDAIVKLHYTAHDFLGLNN